MPQSPKYQAVAFDLLTALLDSWTLWNDVAGSPEAGIRWRARYLEVTYTCGAYRPYETLVREAAADAGFPATLGDRLVSRWEELQPWPEAPRVLDVLARHVPLGVATNCSVVLGNKAARRAGAEFKSVITAEEAGYYKPRPEPYRALIAALGTLPERTLFVAGSAADVPGARQAGMPVYWHNRIGRPAIAGAVPDFEERSLDRLVDIMTGSE